LVLIGIVCVLLGNWLGLLLFLVLFFTFSLWFSVLILSFHLLIGRWLPRLILQNSIISF